MQLVLNWIPPLQSGRRFAAWLLCCLLSFALAACGGDDDGEPGGNAPSITTQPASATVVVGQTATFNVVAAGSDPLSYQWQKNGAPIDGATGTSYTTPATVAADNGSRFRVVVSNAFGTVTSDEAVLTVGPPVAPIIVTPPVAQTVTEGATATFMAKFSGTEPISYQWARNDVDIPGATSTTYTTPATTVAADNGALYAVTATNAGGFKKTDPVQLTVNRAPTPVSITTQPVPKSVTTGETATFTVTADGDAPITYQWYRNSALIGGATAASYTTAATVAADDGAKFKVTVTNPFKSVTSDEVTLKVTTTPAPPPAPVITGQPQDANPVVGAAASFSVTATSTVPMTYQWYRGTTAITGATASTYTIASVAQTDDGAKFKVIVSNVTGSTQSREATLSITPQPPVIPSTQPEDRSISVGQTATFSVDPTGTSPFTYLWKKNGTTIAGATAASYTTPAATTGDNGALYTVTVSNNAPNGTVTSRQAKLTVGPVRPPVIGTQPTSASAPVGTTATFMVTLSDGTTPFTYQWFKNDIAIPGATADSYTTPVVSFADDQAKYKVKVSNPSPTTVTSNEAVLTVTLPITPVVQVSAGDRHSVALRSSGAIYSWSDWIRPDLNARAGAGQNDFSAGAAVRARNVDNTPFLGIASVSAGTTHSALVKTDGTVWTWGDANRADLVWCPIGDGSCLTRFYPTQVKDASGVPFTGVKQVVAASYYSVAVKTDGTVWSWGTNRVGTLGDGSTTGRLNPVQVTDPTTGGFFTGATAVAANIDHAMALKSDGTVYAWGNNADGEIGDGSTSSGTSVPKRVEVTAGVPLSGIIAIAAGERHSVALKSDGTVYAWGYNTNGALGDGTTTNRLRATVMHDTAGNPVTNVAAIAAGQNFTILLLKDGTLLATGQNDIGQLGDNSTAASQINPVPVRDAAGAVFGSVVAISSYHQHTVVYRNDGPNGSVWAWGLNDSRQLGDTTNVNRRNPVPAPAYVP